MEKKVIIDMKSVQTIYDDRTETELSTSGKMSEKDGTYYISYEDTEATGFPGAVTKITVKGNELASVSRTGDSISDLVMEKGKKHYCHYTTPYGSIMIGVYTHAIENRIEDEGSVYMQYTLDINSGYISDNEIIMNIKPDGC